MKNAEAVLSYDVLNGFKIGGFIPDRNSKMY
jgi:hypothetical protein